MMNKSLLVLLFFAVLIIGSYGKATQLRDNLEKRATGMSEQSLHVKKMLSRKNPKIKGMISSKAAKPVPKCPMRMCPRTMIPIGCRLERSNEKDRRGCPKDPCGKVVCDKCPPPICPATLPRPGCKKVHTEEKDSDGCPKHPCGKEVCHDEPVEWFVRAG